MDLFHYLTLEGRNPYQDWLERVKDMKARIAVLRRVERLRGGNFGDCSYCRAGVWELRIDIGAGYRVYYARPGKDVILFLCGGVKKTQDTDIDRAASYWQDYQRRTR